ncbi:histidine triad protein HinT [Mycoplasmopsis agassizii]|uniref:histidine triad protein HinT n=1 Tax=Mycoplasmopsis agassizii TaxID=33922 RepID=UPI003527DEAE
MEEIHLTFKKIINRELASEIIYEDDKVIAIMDKFPYNPGHFLVITKNHSVNLKDSKTDDMTYAFAKAVELANVRRKEGHFEDFKVVVNNGRDAGQVIDHLHIHIIPFYPKDKKEK